VDVVEMVARALFTADQRNNDLSSTEITRETKNLALV
jgi:hypothetical protein